MAQREKSRNYIRKRSRPCEVVSRCPGRLKDAGTALRLKDFLQSAGDAFDQRRERQHDKYLKKVVANPREHERASCLSSKAAWHALVLPWRRLGGSDNAARAAESSALLQYPTPPPHPTTERSNRRSHQPNWTVSANSIADDMRGSTARLPSIFISHGEC
jgi:hypothetical protein